MNKHIAVMLLIGVLLIAYFGTAFHLRYKYRDIYNEAIELLDAGDYDAAINRIDDIPDYVNYRDVAEVFDLHKVCPHCGSVLE